jgi:hypothetical protein
MVSKLRKKFYFKLLKGPLTFGEAHVSLKVFIKRLKVFNTASTDVCGLSMERYIF